ncbi:MAG: xanthine dehydrogenase small subunit [Alphaproteobacteria bacterium]
MSDEQTVIRYLHRGEVRTVEGIDPNLTLLRYLREVEGLVGTKEGCAEGDCGACTVVLGELDGDTVRYRAVNACILFAPVLDGKQLIVVEDLESEEGALHPVQQALVDHHGSQCGFCTPGFVMSLFALFHEQENPARATVADAIAGNLCRCTGYRPILAAAEAMYEGGAADEFTARKPGDAARLKGIQRTGTLALTGAGRRYFAPTTTDALATLLEAHPDACLLAGGTDVGLWVTKEHRALETIIYTGDVRELRTIRESDGTIEIGAGVTYTDALPVLARHYPDVGELFRRLGAVQVRNVGTIAGNIGNASPIGDSPPPLIALGASLVLRRGAKRRELPLDAFVQDYRKTALAPGEFIERVRVPGARPNRAFRVYKISKRFDQDISAVCGAFALTREGDRITDARICYGGMATTPKRASRAEAALRGERWTEKTARAAMTALDRDFAPITDFRASAEYRQRVARNLLYKFYLETAADRPGRVVTRVLEYA